MWRKVGKLSHHTPLITGGKQRALWGTREHLLGVEQLREHRVLMRALSPSKGKHILLMRDARGLGCGLWSRSRKMALGTPPWSRSMNGRSAHIFNSLHSHLFPRKYSCTYKVLCLVCGSQKMFPRGNRVSRGGVRGPCLRMENRRGWRSSNPPASRLQEENRKKAPLPGSRIILDLAAEGTRNVAQANQSSPRESEGQELART